MLTHFSILILHNRKMRYSLHSLTCKIMPEEKEMPRRPDEIAVKWIKSKDARKTSRAVQYIYSPSCKIPW